MAVAKCYPEVTIICCTKANLFRSCIHFTGFCKPADCVSIDEVSFVVIFFKWKFEMHILFRFKDLLTNLATCQRMINILPDIVVMWCNQILWPAAFIVIKQNWCNNNGLWIHEWLRSCHKSCSRLGWETDNIMPKTTRSQAVARIADRTAKNCTGHVT